MLSIIGCGNSNRSDDGAGVYVVQRLKEQLSKAPSLDVQIFDAGTAGMDVMFQARGSNALIIIDASCSGSEPGAVFEAQARRCRMSRAFFWFARFLMEPCYICRSSDFQR